MPKQVKQAKRPSDINELAHRLVELSTADASLASPLPQSVSDYMAAMGRKGGQIGGKKRLKTMTKEQRHKVAVKAAKARWRKPKRDV